MANNIFPEKDAALSFSMKKFKIEDQVYQTPLENNTAYVFLIVRELFNYTVAENGTVYYDPGDPHYLPQETFLEIKIGDMLNETENISFDVSDDKDTHAINILAISYDPRDNSTSYLDLDGSDESWGILIFYNLSTGEFYGDDNDGIVDGSKDGVTGDIDCYLEYSIKTV